MTYHALVIYNPSSKSQMQTEKWMGDLVAGLNKSGHYLVSFFPTTAETQASDLVPLIAPSLKLVIAAGGDGTIRLALGALALAKSAVPAALFPIGTGNVLARNVGIVRNSLLANPLADVYDYLANGVPMRMDLGMMNGEYFAGMAGVGPLSDAFMLPARHEKTNGKLIPYMKNLLATLAMPSRFFKITTGGRTFKVQASGVFISNVEDLGIGRDSNVGRLSDGFFDLHIIDPQTGADYVALTRRYGAGNLEPNSAESVFRVKEAAVEVIPRLGIRSKFQCLAAKFMKLVSGKTIQPARETEMSCMIDGDSCGKTPMRVTVIPSAVNILVPAQKKPLKKPVLELAAVENKQHAIFELPAAASQ